MTQEEEWRQAGLQVTSGLQQLSSSATQLHHPHYHHHHPASHLPPRGPKQTQQKQQQRRPASSSSSLSQSQHHQQLLMQQQQQQQKLNPFEDAVYVDTIITDSFGNTIRYDSQEDVHGGTGKGRRHSGPAIVIHGVNTTSASSSSSPSASPRPRGSGGGGGGGRERGRGGSLTTPYELGVFETTIVINNKKKKNDPAGRVGLTVGGSGSDCSSGGGKSMKGGGVSGGGGGSGGRSPTPTPSSVTLAPKSAPNSRPSSPRPENKRSKVDGAGKKPHRATNRRHSTASVNAHMSSQDTWTGGGGPLLNVPTLALTADPLSSPTSSSGGHQPNRASSFREGKVTGGGAGKTGNALKVDDMALGHIRRNSMPNVTNSGNLLNVPGSSSFFTGSSSDLMAGGDDGDSHGSGGGGIRRVRSFKTTSKGIIVNRGDSFKKRSTHSLMSTGSTVTDSEARAGGGGAAGRSGGSSNNGHVDYATERAQSVVAGGPGYFRVCMMGAAGVGKTSMAHQFLTSDYVDHDDADESPQMTVTVLLDGEESTIEFVDPPDRNVITEEQLLDAFVVVFAINDHDSFATAQQLVRYLRVDYGTDRAILLVANKIDLVRKRKVTADEARMVATTFDCKYAETSAALNHHVDELLVGIITQIRLQLSIPFTTILFPNKDAGKDSKSKKPRSKGPKGFFSRLFRRGGSRNEKNKDKAVENLMY